MEMLFVPYWGSEAYFLLFIYFPLLSALATKSSFVEPS